MIKVKGKIEEIDKIVREIAKDRIKVDKKKEELNH